MKDSEGNGLFFYEPSCLEMANQKLNVRIINGNQTESIVIDLSCLLWPKEPNQKFEWTFDKLATLPILQLKICVEFD